MGAYTLAIIRSCTGTEINLPELRRFLNRKWDGCTVSNLVDGEAEICISELHVNEAIGLLCVLSKKFDVLVDIKHGTLGPGVVIKNEEYKRWDRRNRRTKSTS